MSEIQFRRKVVEAFEEAGFMATVVEPNLGSTPGTPDLVLSKGINDWWVELKVINRHKTTEQIWERCLRSAQRQWIRRRLEAAGGESDSMLIFVFVRTPTGINVYCACSDGLCSAINNCTMDEIVSLLNGYQ
jgi:hypothetical protein